MRDSKGRFTSEQVPWNKGLSRETNEKVRKMCGNLMPFRRGDQPWNKDLKKENDTRVASIGKNMTGIKNPMYGKHPSAEARIKMKENAKGMRGQNHSALTKGKISLNRRDKLRGCENPNWKGGTTSLYLRIRQLREYTEWRLAVFKRDNFTCVNCHKVGGWLEGHHIESFSQIINENHITSIIEAQMCKELWARYNGVTLCRDCHAVIDPRRYSSKKPVKEERMVINRV